MLEEHKRIMYDLKLGQKMKQLDYQNTKPNSMMKGWKGKKDLHKEFQGKGQ